MDFELAGWKQSSKLVNKLVVQTKSHTVSPGLATLFYDRKSLHFKVIETNQYPWSNCLSYLNDIRMIGDSHDYDVDYFYSP